MMRKAGVLLSAAAFVLGSGENAFAYLDPGAGGVLYQVVILVIVIGVCLGYANLKKKKRNVISKKIKDSEPEDFQD